MPCVGILFNLSVCACVCVCFVCIYVSWLVDPLVDQDIWHLSSSLPHLFFLFLLHSCFDTYY